MVSERRAFGERLQQQRQRRGMTLEAISLSTKVPVGLFAGLERGDCSRWPAGIYARSYIRAYAEAVGLNAAETVEEFGVVFGAAAAAGDAPATPARGPLGPPLRIGMADEPLIEPRRLARRAGLAAADILIGVLIAAVAYVGLGTGAWTAIAGIVAYHAVGRLISDEPLLYWMYLRARQPAAPAPADPASDEVRVADPASTTA